MQKYTASRRTNDPTDIRILEILQADGQISNKRLAEKVALSPSACLARVRRLEEDGLITGYHAEINVAKVRPTLQMIAEIAFKQHNPALLNDFDSALRTFPQVVSAFRVSGPYDYVIRLIVTDMQEWRSIAESILELDPGVEKMVTHVVISETKPFPGYPLA